MKAVTTSAPPLLLGGGTFLVLLFLLSTLAFSGTQALWHPEVFYQKGFWFYVATVVWFTLRRSDMLAFGTLFGFGSLFCDTPLQGECGMKGTPTGGKLNF